MLQIKANLCGDQSNKWNTDKKKYQRRKSNIIISEIEAKNYRNLNLNDPPKSERQQN